MHQDFCEVAEAVYARQSDLFHLRYAEIGLSVDAFGRSAIDQYELTLSFLVERASGQFDYVHPKLRRVFNAWMLLPLRTSEDSSSSESDGEAWLVTRKPPSLQRMISF